VPAQVGEIAGAVVGIDRSKKRIVRIGIELASPLEFLKALFRVLRR